MISILNKALKFCTWHRPWQAKFPDDNTAQQSVSSKPVDRGYAVTNADTVVAKDNKKGKKVCMQYVCFMYTYVHS